MKNTITINGSDYTVKPGMKAILVFEKIAKKLFQIKTVTDTVTYIYASIVAGTPGTQLGFEELLDAFDASPELLNQCTKLVLTPTAADNLVKASNETEGGTEPKKE